MQDGTEKEVVKSSSAFNSTIDIPENATRIKFYAQANVVLNEIQPSN